MNVILKNISVIISEIKQINITHNINKLNEISINIENTLIANFTKLVDIVIVNMSNRISLLNDTIRKIISDSGNIEELIKEAQKNISNILFELNTTLIIEQ